MSPSTRTPPGGATPARRSSVASRGWSTVLATHSLSARRRHSGPERTTNPTARLTATSSRLTPGRAVEPHQQGAKTTPGAAAHVGQADLDPAGARSPPSGSHCAHDAVRRSGPTSPTKATLCSYRTGESQVRDTSYGSPVLATGPKPRGQRSGIATAQSVSHAPSLFLDVDNFYV